MLCLNQKNTVRRGFTIVELVIVILLIAILAAILIPTFASIAEDTEQRALKLELGTAYTSFRADCGFRDEPVQNMDQYTFVKADALQYSGSTVKINAAGYRWNGRDNEKVATVAASSIDTSSATAIYGPFDGYYLLGKGLALVWNGSGSSTSPYLIHSYQELRSLAERVARGETFSGEYFRLEADLSIVYSSWLPIGGYVSPTQTSDTAFSGVFDGNGFTIALAYGRVDQDSYCLFGYTNGATIKNLKTSGLIQGTANMGGIIGKANNTTVQNCMSTVSVSGTHHVGGIVGNATGSTKISGCINEGSIEAFATASNNAAGGIVGEASANVTIQDCNNRGKITGHGGTVGGIAGIAKGSISYCINNGDVNASGYAAQKVSGGKDSLAGGILGWGAGTAKVDSCGNTGNVTAAYRTAGGIVGGDAIITNAANAGNITASGYAGGIQGTVSNVSCTVTNVMNAGTVAAKGENNNGTFSGPAGGIVGKVNSTSQYTVTLAVNGGQVHYRKGVSGVSYTEVGMIVGSANGKVVLTNNYLSVSTGVYIGTGSATATAVGKSSSTSGTPTVQTNQSSLASALNGLVGTNRKWTTESGFFKGLYVPILTYTATFDFDRDGSRLNTAFTGASAVYMPFPDQNVISSDGKQYYFDHWWSSGSKYQPGGKVILSQDSRFSATRSLTSNKPITPIPFE